MFSGLIIFFNESNHIQTISRVLFTLCNFIFYFIFSQNSSWSSGISEGEKREDRAKEIFEIILVKNFPILTTHTKYKPKEVKRIASRINVKFCTQAYHNQATKKQRRKDILKRAKLDQQDKNSNELLIRCHTSKKTVG